MGLIKMKKIQDLPTDVSVNLEEGQGVQYPKNGDFEACFSLKLLCFNKKNYLKTWPLRQRIMQANTESMTKLAGLFDEETRQKAEEQAEQQTDEPVDVDSFKMMMMMSGFDAQAAMEEFKQFAVAGSLIELDDGIFMNKERWAQVDDDVKETVLFTYLANFIQPCVL